VLLFPRWRYLLFQEGKNGFLNTKLVSIYLVGKENCNLMCGFWGCKERLFLKCCDKFCINCFCVSACVIGFIVYYFYFQSLKHNPNGRFVVVCGDGEYIIYTALAWRNRSFGSALEFAWSTDGEYAVRESTSKIKIFSKNFQVCLYVQWDVGSCWFLFASNFLSLLLESWLSVSFPPKEIMMLKHFDG